MADEEITISATPKIRKRIDVIKKKLGFSKDQDGLFLKYCLMVAYKPHAADSEKLRLSEEIKLIKKFIKEKNKN